MLSAVDHVQLAAPPGSEDELRGCRFAAGQAQADPGPGAGGIEAYARRLQRHLERDSPEV